MHLDKSSRSKEISAKAAESPWYGRDGRLLPTLLPVPGLEIDFTYWTVANVLGARPQNFGMGNRSRNDFS